MKPCSEIKTYYKMQGNVKYTQRLKGVPTFYREYQDLEYHKVVIFFLLLPICF